MAPLPPPPWIRHPPLLTTYCHVWESVLCPHGGFSLQMQAYAAITYYLQNKPQIDAYIKEREKEREVIKAEIETQFPTASIRERLLSRIGKEQKDW